VYLRLASAPDARQDDAVLALERAGHPLVRITVDGPYDLGAELFRWEFATAVAGSVLGINAFDQPDVEASKVATRRLMDEYERTGTLPPESPTRVSEGNLAATLGAHLRTIRPGDYVAILAYVEMSAAHEATLQAIRRAIRDRYRVATCLGFGPRFLHSTGQAYKGGPNTGVFLQITCEDAADLAVPGQAYTFGVVKGAQARGDLAVLAERGRRALRVHLDTDATRGLQTLRAAVDRAIG
jgi:transaldolase / glucose-6-phosphate isomerase